MDMLAIKAITFSQCASHIRVESLEQRICLAAVLTGDILMITGSAGNDAITISLDARQTTYTVKLNHSNAAYPRAAVRFIQVDGGDGNDKVTIGSTVKLRTSLVGGLGNDMITGGNGNDVINGGDGDDQLNGGNGKDTIHGDAGNDLIQGGAGDDQLFGNDGFDQAYGDAGNDNVQGGANDDALGGDDEDVLYLRGQSRAADVAGNDSLDGGDGNDWLLSGINTGKHLKDKSGLDTLLGSGGRDVIDARNSQDLTDTTIDDIVPNIDSKGTAQTTHVTFNLRIQIKNHQGNFQDVLIPSAIGIFADHTTRYHTDKGDSAGLVHYDSDQPADIFPLVNFFRTWGISLSNLHIGRFVGAVSMKVNGQASALYGGYVPRQGDKIVFRVG